MREIIHFYHINDLHSHFEHWKRIENFIHERKKWHLGAEEETIILDLGDHSDRFHPFTEALSGKGNVKLLNNLGCQYVTIGNNEGITFSYEELDHLYDDATFNVLVANLYNQSGERPSWAKPYHIHQTVKGTRIAFIGATAYFRVFYEMLGWKITDPQEEIIVAVDEVKNQCDVIVLLSHLGLEHDKQLAEHIPEIDIILGAHTHHILHEGMYVQNTLLCGAGKGGTFVGHVEIEVDTTKHPISKKTRLYNMNEQDPVNNESEFTYKLFKIGKERLEKEVCHLPRSLPVRWFEESTITKLLCDALQEYCQADCAFINAGLLLDGLKKGPVTLFDLHRICPHPINPCVIEMSGQELKEVLLQSQNPDWPHKQVKGFGFRGSILGVMIYSNIKIISPKEIYIGDVQLDLKKTYTLAIPDMYTFGYFFPSIKRSEKKTYKPVFLRNVLASKLSTMSM